MDTFRIAIAFAIFISVALLVEGVYVWWNANYGHDARRLAQRLRSAAQAQGAAPAQVHLVLNHPQVECLLEKSRLASGLARLLAQAGSRLTLLRFFLISAGAAGATLIVLLFTRLPAAAAAGIALGAGALPLLFLLRAKGRRVHQIVTQLPETLDLLSRALRAGHALPSAIKMAADEVPAPLGEEMRILFNEVNYGLPMQDALKNLSNRVDIGDVSFFVVAVLIQRETGGNLSELLDTIARIVRERLKLLGQVKVFSAEGRLSALILGLLPFVLGGLLYLVNPGFMATLWKDPSGLKMLAVVAVLMAVGVVWMRSVIRIRI